MRRCMGGRVALLAVREMVEGIRLPGLSPLPTGRLPFWHHRLGRLLWGRLGLHSDPHDHVPGIPDAVHEEQDACECQYVKGSIDPQQQTDAGSYKQEVTDRRDDEIPHPIVPVGFLRPLLLPHVRHHPERIRETQEAHENKQDSEWPPCQGRNQNYCGEDQHVDEMDERRVDKHLESRAGSLGNKSGRKRDRHKHQAN